MRHEPLRQELIDWFRIHLNCEASIDPGQGCARRGRLPGLLNSGVKSESAAWAYGRLRATFDATRL